MWLEGATTDVKTRIMGEKVACGVSHKTAVEEYEYADIGRVIGNIAAGGPLCPRSPPVRGLSSIGCRRGPACGLLWSLIPVFAYWAGKLRSREPCGEAAAASNEPCPAVQCSALDWPRKILPERRVRVLGSVSMSASCLSAPLLGS